MPRSPESKSPTTRREQAPVETQPRARPSRSTTGLVAGVLHRHSILLLICVLSVVFSVMAPETFPTMANLQGLALQNSVATLLALAVLLVVVVGEFDLSVGYTLGLSAVLSAKLTSELGVSVPFTILATLAVGTIVGLASGLLVARLKVVSLTAPRSPAARRPPRARPSRPRSRPPGPRSSRRIASAAR